jgi:hypothetical protein
MGLPSALGPVGVASSFGVAVGPHAAVGAHTLGQYSSAEGRIAAGGRTEGRKLALVGVRPRSNCQHLSTSFVAEALREASTDTERGQWQPIEMWGDLRQGSLAGRWRRPGGEGLRFDSSAGDWYYTLVQGKPS